MSIFKDTRTLATQVVKMVDAIMSDKEVPVNDTGHTIMELELYLHIYVNQYLLI